MVAHVIPGNADKRFADPLYSRIAELIYREAGIVLGPEKVSMMNARLNKRIVTNGCADLAEYVRRLDGGELPSEHDFLVSALTTNFTHFFREGHHFDFLRQVVFQEPFVTVRSAQIWSAGCSSGQEPYSAAITAQQAGCRATITATDIDQTILAQASAATYRESELSGVSPELVNLGFARTPAGYQVTRKIREMVTFQHLNLHAAWPFDTKFDVIFCRNVIIYFDAAAQMRLWEKFCRQLRPGGWLFIGHSESIPDHLRDRLRPVRHTIYQYISA